MDHPSSKLVPLIEDSVEQELDTVPRADKLDAGDAVFRAPGAAAAWSMDGASDDSESYSTPLERVLKRARGNGVRTDAAAGDHRAVSESAVLDSMEDVPDVVDDDVPDSMEDVPDAVDGDVPDSIDEVPDSMESVEDLPDAVDDAPDIDKVVHCPRCRTFHAGGVFGEACREARRNARRCARCGLLHEDYDLLAIVLDGMEKFDCNFYIPVVEELQMSGNTIILPEQVVQKLDEMNEAREKVKQANKEGESSKDEASKRYDTCI
jgi:hypothetical protein